MYILMILINEHLTQSCTLEHGHARWVVGPEPWRTAAAQMRSACMPPAAALTRHEYAPESALRARSSVRRGGSRLVPLRTPKSRRLDDIMADADRAGKRTAAAITAYDSESDGPIPKVCPFAVQLSSSSRFCTSNVTVVQSSRVQGTDNVDYRTVLIHGAPCRRCREEGGRQKAGSGCPAKPRPRRGAWRGLTGPTMTRRTTTRRGTRSGAAGRSARPRSRGVPQHCDRAERHPPVLLSSGSTVRESCSPSLGSRVNIRFNCRY